jgi:hypothetical protein
MTKSLNLMAYVYVIWDDNNIREFVYPNAFQAHEKAMRIRGVFGMSVYYSCGIYVVVN